MVEGIINYIQSFLVLFLLIKVLLFLIPRSAFEKYISFFSGVILAIGVLRPMFLLFDMEESWQKTLYAATFEKHALEASINVAKLSESNETFYCQQMKALVEEEIKKQIEFLEIGIKEVEVDLTGDYKVDSIRIVVLGENEEGNARLLEYFEKEYHLSAEQYEIVYE